MKYWSGDQMAYLDELVRLVKKCKQMSRKACTAARVKGGKKGRDEVGIDMWKERGTRVCLILASQLIEMKVRTASFFLFFLRHGAYRCLIIYICISVHVRRNLGLCRCNLAPRPAPHTSERHAQISESRLCCRTGLSAIWLAARSCEAVCRGRSGPCRLSHFEIDQRFFACRG